MSEPLTICILGANDPRLFERIRDRVEREGRMIVNVGTIGHVDHDSKGISGLADVVVRQIRAPELDGIRIRHIGVKSGKGQRKANKANRWR